MSCEMVQRIAACMLSSGLQSSGRCSAARTVRRECMDVFLLGVSCVRYSDRLVGLKHIQVAAIKKEDLVTEDDAKDETTEEEQEQAGEIEKEDAGVSARRRTRRDT